jgi:TATA-box binding protein (TBP) (component of TFIID and TFIIIB)
MWSTEATAGGTVELEGEAAPGSIWRLRHPRVTLLLDEKRRLEGLILALGKEIEELRAPMAEMEAALERKTKATTVAVRRKSSGVN